MMARSSAASRASGATRQALPRLAMVAALVIAATTLGATATLAAKGGGNAGTTTSSIEFASINGGVMLASAQDVKPKLGDTVTFATTVEPLAGWEYPMVATTCYQDVDNSGTIDTSILGPDIVFSSLTKPDAPVTLGGYSSIWTDRGGGDAVCRADLDAYGWKGSRQSIRVLALKAFDAAG